MDDTRKHHTANMLLIVELRIFFTKGPSRAPLRPRTRRVTKNPGCARVAVFSLQEICEVSWLLLVDLFIAIVAHTPKGCNIHGQVDHSAAGGMRRSESRLSIGHVDNLKHHLFEGCDSVAMSVASVDWRGAFLSAGNSFRHTENWKSDVFSGHLM